MLRRAELLEHVLAGMRQEVMASRMMAALLHKLMRALGADGAAILDLVPPEAPLDGLEADPAGGAGRVLHFAGADPRPLLAAAAHLLLHAEDDMAVSWHGGGIGRSWPARPPPVSGVGRRCSFGGLSPRGLGMPTTRAWPPP